MRVAKILFFLGFLAKIRYTWPLAGQNQLHAKNKNKHTPQKPWYWPGWHHSWFWLEKAKVYLFFSTLSSFQLISANFEPIREAIRTLCFLSVCVCPPSVEIFLLLTYKLWTRTSYVKVRSYACIYPGMQLYTCVRSFHFVSSLKYAKCFCY